MEMGLFRGIITLLLFLAFVGLVVWAWSGKRKTDFEQAANLPLNDEAPQAHEEGERHE